MEWWAVIARVTGVTNHPATPKASEKPERMPGFLFSGKVRKRLASGFLQS
ncbi:hypothetical protein [Vibrio cholerae]|nr:hypothetical protein [Vibrio cholerae]